MGRLFEDNKKNPRYNLVINTIQTFTILSQQNKRDTGTFKLHNIYKRFTVTVVSDWKKNSNIQINAALEYTPHWKRLKFNKLLSVYSNKYVTEAVNTKQKLLTLTGEGWMV